MEHRVANQELWLDAVEIGAFDAAEIEEVLGVLSRGMRDNPLHIAVFGEDPERRGHKFRRLISGVFAVKDFSHTLVARREDGVNIRHSSVKRVASAVGEGAIAIQMIHEYLTLSQRSERSSTSEPAASQTAVPKRPITDILPA
jgi:hypothetical protein